MASGLGTDRRLHLEELDEVRQEQRLVGDVRERGEERLDAAVRPDERSGEELQVAPAQIAVHRPEDDVRVRAVVAARADEREERARQQTAACEADVLVVELIGELRVFAGDERREPEQLQLFRCFLACSELSQVIEAPASRRLLDVERVAEEREVAFTHERRHHRQHQQREQPWREVGDARREGEDGDALLQQRTERVDHADAVGCLDARALERIVERRIFVGAQVEPRGVRHHPHADVAGEAIGQQRIEEAAGTAQASQPTTPSAHSSATSHQKSGRSSPVVDRS